MSLRQLPLDLPPVTAMGRADFFVAPCNTAALAATVDPAVWPVPRMIICGPAGSGRTHLAHVFAEATGGTVISARDLAAHAPIGAGGTIAVDDADAVAGVPEAEEAVFHLHNAVAQGGGALLLTGAGMPSAWGIVLPDLASRLAACPVTALLPPDDSLLMMVLAKLFDDRQLRPEPEVLSYLAQRMERSLGAARTLVAAIDRRALAQRRRVTRPLAAEVLAEYAD